MGPAPTEGLGLPPRQPSRSRPTDRVPGVGDVAPAVATRTLDSHPLEEISSDDDPDPTFYQLSLDVALQQRTTYCRRFRHARVLRQPDLRADVGSGQGGSPGPSDANFLHVEIYENLDATSADELIIDPAVGLGPPQRALGLRRRRRRGCRSPLRRRNDDG